MKENKISKEELEQIGTFARKEMTEEEIFSFSLILCDNEIDRDREKFTIESLEKLAKLFVGKTGIFDHNMSGKNQNARIYSAWVENDPTRKTADGEIYTCVKAKAYMVRTETNKDLIAEIDAGIKKETSVGCSVKSVKCSICGKDIKTEGCEHIKGKEYGGKICCHHLCEPEDAYEWSFVAVPAQKNAGVVKSYTPKEQEDITAMYREDITGDIIKYSALVMPNFTGIKKICALLPIGELREMRNAFKAQSQKNLPLVRQLEPINNKEEDRKEDNNEYII
jgi:hypothetical protein